MPLHCLLIIQHFKLRQLEGCLRCLRKNIYQYYFVFVCDFVTLAAIVTQLPATGKQLLRRTQYYVKFLAPHSDFVYIIFYQSVN